MANYPYAYLPLATGFPDGIITSTLNEDSAVGGLTDNHTALNKAGVKSTIGRQIALIQNFVNSKYLGRDTLYIEDSYLHTVHTDTLISTGYLNSSDWYSQGNITLCSNLVPAGNDGITVGAYNAKIGIAYMSNLSVGIIDATRTDSLLSAGGIGAHLLIRSTDQIVMAGNVRPSADSYFDLGLPTAKYAHGFFDVLDSDIIYGSAAITGVTLCSNMTPGTSGSMNLGSSSLPFANVATDAFQYIYPPDAYSVGAPHRLWVDVSGYVRYGNV